MSKFEFPTISDTVMSFMATQKQMFEGDSHMMPAGNHKEHDLDPDYWNILLGPVKSDPDKYGSGTALDFGCGCGRNIRNLLSLARFSRVDGCDISTSNAAYAGKYINNLFPYRQEPHRTKTWETNGWDLGPVEDESYNFIMSHVVFQHIGNHQVRLNLLTEMFRALKPNGIVSLHFMDLADSVPYYYNSPDGTQNCRVENPEFLLRELEAIGYYSPVVVSRIDMYSGRRSYFVQGGKKIESLGEEE
mgnify:CR=1 FL=1